MPRSYLGIAVVWLAVAPMLRGQQPQQVDELLQRVHQQRGSDRAAALRDLRALWELVKDSKDDQNAFRWRWSCGAAALGLDFGIAEQVFRSSAAAFDTGNPQDFPWLQTSREQLAAALAGLKRREDEIALRQTIVDAWHQAGEAVREAEQRAFLGQALVQSGKAEAARRGLKEFVAALASLAKDDLGPEARDVWAYVAHLYTIALVDMGQMFDDRLKDLQQQVLDYYRTHPPREPGELIDLLWESANVRLERGELAAARSLAEESFERSVQAFTAKGIRTFYPRAFKANLLKNMGDLAAALPLCRENCELCDQIGLPAQHTMRARAWSNLGHALLVQGEWQQAAEALKKSLAAHDPTDTDPLVTGNRGYVYDNLAECLANLNEFDAAKEQSQKALAMDLPPVTRASIEGGLAIVLQRAGELEAAAEHFDACMKLVVATRGYRQPVKYLRCQAEVLHSLGKQEGLTNSLKTLLDVARRGLGECHTLPGRPSYQLATVVDDAARTVLSLAGKARDRQGLERQAFEILESLRGIELRTTHLATQLASRPEFAEQREKALAARAELSRLASTGTGDWQQLLEEVGKRERQEFDAMFRSCEQIAVQPLRLTVDELAQSLPNNAAIVTYRVLPLLRPDPDRKGTYLQEEHFLAHVVTKVGKGGVLQQVDLGKASEIQAAAETWRIAILANDVRGRPAAGASSGPDPAAELSKKIFLPLAGKVGANKILLVCLDDVLCTVPIELMPDVKKGEYELRFVVSLEQLVATPVAAGKPSLLAVGGLDFDTMPQGAAGSGEPLAPGAADARGDGSDSTVTTWTWPALKSSRDEADNACAAFRAKFGADADGSILSGTEASRQNLMTKMRGKRFLHLATHGYFLKPTTASDRYQVVARLAPMALCGLTLSGANATDKDFLGVITGEDIAALDLSGCELAVLSACETAEGTSRAGHGLASLQGAFHAAGTKLVLATRWEIPDEYTMQLLREFYARLWNRKQPHTAREALALAKKALSAKAIPVKNWAGFVLTGDPRQ